VTTCVNVFFPVGTRLFRDGVSPSLQLRNLGAILDQYERHFVDLSADLHAHARIALDVGPPRFEAGTSFAI